METFFGKTAKTDDIPLWDIIRFYNHTVNDSPTDFRSFIGFFSSQIHSGTIVFCKFTRLLIEGVVTAKRRIPGTIFHYSYQFIKNNLL